MVGGGFSFRSLGQQSKVKVAMKHDYKKRTFSLPNGCKNLSDVIKRKAQTKRRATRRPLHTNEEVREVFRRYVPAIASGRVEIVSMARNVGRRCLLVVRSNDPKVSAVQACSFRRGDRQTAFIRELCGELPTIIVWRESPEELIRDACTFPYSRVVLDAERLAAVVTIDRERRHRVGEDPIARMLSELTGLVSELTGWKVRLTEPDKA